MTHEHQKPTGENRELSDRAVLAAVQGIARETLVILLREVWRNGHI